MNASYRPEHVLLAGWAVYLSIYFLAPLQPLVELQTGSVLFILANCLLFACGSRVADHIKRKTPRAQVMPTQMLQLERSMFRGFLSVGLLGNALRLIDKYFLRGAWALSGFEAREALTDTSTSFLGIVGAVLYPFGYLPIFIYLGSKFLNRSRLRLFLAMFVFLIPAVDAIVLFSRSFILVSFAMIFFGVSLTIFRGRGLSLKLIVPVVLFVSLIAFISTAVFAWRLDEMQLEVTDSMIDSAYAYTIRPSDAALELIAEGGIGGQSTAALIPLTQYYTHSIFEFQLLWHENNDQMFSFGSLHFAPYVKFLSVAGIMTEPDMFDLFPRVGVFTSFFGPLWVDFGWCSFLVMFVFGLVARQVARGAKVGSLATLPLYTYFCVILFFAPVVNFFISSQGMYVVNAFAIFWFVSRKHAVHQVSIRA